MHFDLERVRANAKAAGTEDLLDRATVFREGMEPAALEIIEAELQQRGVGADQIADHGKRRLEEVIVDGEGNPARCSYCRKPAIAKGWGWHRLWGRIPLFPRLEYYCPEHRGRS